MITKHCILLSIFGINLLLLQNSFSTAPNTIVGTISDPNETFDGPVAIAITQDGGTAYVVNEYGDSISIVDLTTSAVIGIVSDPGDTLEAPIAIAITPDNTTAYIVNNSPDANSVSVLDIANNIITQIVADGNFSLPVDIAITPDGTTAYVTNQNNNTVSIIDVANNTVMGTVSDPGTTLDSPTALAISYDGSKAYIVNANNTVSVLTIDGNVINHLVSNIFGSTELIDVIFTPDDQKAYLSDFTVNEVYVIDAPVDVAISGFSVTSPQNLAITPNGTTAYAIQTTNNAVSIIDVANNTVIGPVSDPLSTLNSPIALAINLDSTTGYITNLYGNSVSVLFIELGLPTAFYACMKQDIFLTQTDLINFLTWSPPAVNGDTVSYYKIYRDEALTELVATVPASGPLQYYDHNRQPNETYVYYLMAIDDSGNISAPTSAIVICPCSVPPNNCTYVIF